MSADCDGDDELNGDEIANGTNPYESAICNSIVNTDIWSGTLSFKDEAFGEVFEYDSNPDTPPFAGCGLLTIIDPLNHEVNFGPCPADAILDITFIFTPAFDGASDGTVNAEIQKYNCDFLVSTFTATGTYDEMEETIILNYTVDDQGFVFDGILTITTNP